MVNAGNHEANCTHSTTFSQIPTEYTIADPNLGDNGGTTDKTNHIAYTQAICSAGQTNFTGYRNHFRMPSTPSGGLENFWYSYDTGMVHFVHIDTETDLGHGLKGPDEGSPEFGGPLVSKTSRLPGCRETWLPLTGKELHGLLL